MTTERERFEAWAKTQTWPHYWHNGGGMVFNDSSFEAWQAALSAPPDTENRRAQPAAPAILMSAVFVKEGADDFAPQRLLPCGSAVYLVPPDAAPSVAPEPLFLLHSGQIDSGGEQDDWETEADSQVRVDEFCRLHPGQTIPLFAHPPRAPLTDEHVYAVVRSVQPHLATTSKAWRDLVVECRYWLEAAHGIGGK